MAFYYVKSGGTATGDAGRATSARTTSFATMGASAYYDSITEVLDGSTPTTDPVAGDTISVSSVHNLSDASISWALIANAVPVIIQSVDDTAANTLKAGAKETSTGSADITFDTVAGSGYLYGMETEAADDLLLFANSRLLFVVHTFSASGSGDYSLRYNSDGVFCRLLDCVINSGATGANTTRITNGGRLDIIGGSYSGSAINGAFNQSAAGVQGGWSLNVLGLQMTSIATSADIIEAWGSDAAADDTGIIRFYGCRLPASYSGAFIGETLAHGSKKEFEFIGVDDTNAYKYRYQVPQGTVLEETSTYRTSSVDIEGGTNYAYKIDTTSMCSKVHPFRWPLPIQYENLSEAATDTMTLHFTTDATLDSADIALYAGWSDSTNNTLMNFTSSAPKAESHDFIMDHTSAGSSLTAESSEWTNAETNEYSVSVTATSADADSPLAPYLWLELYHSTGANSVYVDSQVEFS